MHARIARLVAVVGSLALLVSTAQVATAYYGSGIDTDGFYDTWYHWDWPVDSGITSRTWMFGPDFTNAFQEDYAQSPGGKRVVQYFDKTRMEVNDPEADPYSLWYVTNGLLATELITGRMQLGDTTFRIREPAEVNVAGDPDGPTGPTYATFATLLARTALAEGTTIVQQVSRAGAVTENPAFAAYGVTATLLVPETQHRIAEPFRAFMWSSGTLWDWQHGTTFTAPLFENPYYVVGFPISEAYWTRVMVGGTYHDVLVQCFERRCLTYTPGNPPEWQVEAGNVGQHYYRWRYADLPQPIGEIAYIGPPYVDAGRGFYPGAVHLVQPDGTDDRTITSVPGGVGPVVWSPDGQKIATAGIYVMNADGSDWRLVTDPGSGGLVWSPDSTRIAFTAAIYDEFNNPQIWIVNADGTGPRYLTEGYDPAWSPKGSQIAFVRRGDTYGRVYVMNADGSNIRQVSQGGAISQNVPGWTPDGEWITFYESHTNYYHAVRPDGASQHQIWSDEVYFTEGSLAWSPDGSRVAFTGSIGFYGGLYVMNPDGSNPILVTEQAEPTESPSVQWSPDGRFIVYSRGDAIRVVNVEHPEWPHRTVAHGMWPQWSPVP